MHPILFKIGRFELPAYGVILVAVFLLVTWLLRREASRLGLNARKTGDLALITLLFGLVGAKLLLILVDWELYIREPVKILGTLRSAGVIYGGLVVGSAGAIWYMRKHKLPMWQTLDVLAPFAALGVGLGRLSCLMAGCCYGIPYEGPFALHFPDHPYCDAPAGVGLFPIQLLSLLNGILLFLGLLWLLRKNAFPGSVIAAYAFFYGLTRGLIEIFRGDEVRGLWLNELLSTSQIIAVGSMVFGLALYLKLRKNHRAGAR